MTDNNTFTLKNYNEMSVYYSEPSHYAMVIFADFQGSVEHFRLVLKNAKQNLLGACRA